MNRCQIQDWYPKFKSLSIRTIIHELPESFIQYLNDSGPLILPLSITEDDAFPNRIHKPEDEEDFQVQEGSEDESEQPPPPPSFPELEMKIKESIGSLGVVLYFPSLTGVLLRTLLGSVLQGILCAPLLVILLSCFDHQTP